MQIEPTAIPEVKLLTPKRFGDNRGYFSEVYNQRVFREAGLDLELIQDNQSLSREVGTLRGLHYQAPPFAQAKLVRVVTGRIYDVAVDIRVGSPTYGRWVGEELSAENLKQLLVPVGFLHAFVTLDPDTTVLYKVTAPYSAAHDGGVAWDDPDIGIVWPLGGSAPVLSAKDGQQPRLKDFANPFRYGA